MLTSENTMRFLFTRIGLFILVAICSFSESEARENTVLILPQIHVKNQETGTFGLSLRNEHLVTGVQIRFTYNSMMGFHMTDIELTSRTTGYEPPSFQIDASNPRDIEVLIVLYSLNGAAIIPGTGDILTIHYQSSRDVFGKSPLLFKETVLSDIMNKPLPVSFEDGCVAAYGRETPFIAGEPVNPYLVIPEPATIWLFVIGLPGLLGLWQRKYNKLE